MQRLILLAVVVLIVPFSALAGSLTLADREPDACETPLVPCDDEPVEWWNEVPGASGAPWYELPMKSVLSADRTTMYTAATMAAVQIPYAYSDYDGFGCLVWATDVDEGSLQWVTIVPEGMGCGFVFDLILEPTTGDLLLAGQSVDHDLTAGVHRLDAQTGARQWSHYEEETYFGAMVVDPQNGGVIVSGSYFSDEEEVFVPFIVPIRLQDGTAGDQVGVLPPGWDFFSIVEIAFDPRLGTVFLSGTADRYTQAGAPFLSKATLHAITPDGAVRWTAHDPNPGNSTGGGLAYIASAERIFLASESGLLTIDPMSGELLGSAEFLEGTAWDYIVSLYDIVYDPDTDRAYMTCYRYYGGYDGAYGVIAAQGADGSMLWIRDMVETSVAFMAEPKMGDDGSLWLTATVEDVQDHDPVLRGALVRYNPDTGEKYETRLAAETVSPYYWTGSHFVAPLEGDEAVVAGVVQQPLLQSAFEARVGLPEQTDQA